MANLGCLDVERGQGLQGPSGRPLPIFLFYYNNISNKNDKNNK